MKERITTYIKSNKVISGSFIMVVGGLLGSFTNYLYHLAIARMGPKDYGILDSLISILYLFSIPLLTMSTVITKYVASFKGQNRMNTIESFFWKLCKLFFLCLPGIIIIIIVATPYVVNFLHLPSPFLFIWLGLSFSLGLFSNIGRSFLQGLTRFFALTVSGLMEGIIRLLSTILLLFLGWGLMGATFPFFIMSVFSVFFTLYMVRDLVRGNKKEPIPEKKQIFTFTLPVLITNLGITSLITSDIILARHFLSGTDAGYYSALSTLGKIVYFAAIPVVSVLFPIISETHAAKKNISKVFTQGLLIMILIMFGALIIFGLFPNFMVMILFGKKYLPVVPYLFIFALGMALYTVNACLLNVYLALREVLPSVFVSVAALLQIILILIFHTNITHFISIFVSISSLLLVLLLLYYWRIRKKFSKKQEISN